MADGDKPEDDNGQNGKNEELPERGAGDEKPHHRDDEQAGRKLSQRVG